MNDSTPDPTAEQRPVNPTPSPAFTRDWFADKVRGWPLVLIFVITMPIVALMSPERVGILLWLLTKAAFYCYFAYWVDRLAFPYARPHMLEGIAHGTAQKRRALLLAAAIFAAGITP